MDNKTADKLRDLAFFAKNTTGFPFDCISFTERVDMFVHFTYLPEAQNIRLPYSTRDMMLDEKEAVEYSVLHEFGHVITDFLIKTNININNFTKQQFEDSLKKYFGIEIVTSEQQYNCFKLFINEFIPSQNLIDAFRIDDACYIDLDDIKAISNTFEKHDESQFKLYYNNSLELFSDLFATKVALDRYLKDGSNVNFEIFARKIQTHIKGVSLNEDIKTKASMQQQMNIFFKRNKKIKINPFAVAKIKRMANKDFSDINKELKILIKKRIDIYNFIIRTYVMPEQEKLLNKRIEQFQKQLLDADEIYKNMPKNKNFDVIANFMPPPDTFSVQSRNTHIKDPLSQAIWFENEFKHNTICQYAVVNPQNIKIYYFYSKPNNLENDINLNQNIEKCITAKANELKLAHQNSQLLPIKIGENDER